MNLSRLWGARYRRRGNQCLACEDWKSAAAQFQKSVAWNPQCVESLQGLGIALLKQQSWAEGEAALERAVSQRSDSPASLLAQLGMARIQLARWPEALEALTRAAEAEPGNVEYHELRGRVLLELESWQDALAAFTRATEIEPHRAGLHELRGHALMRLPDWPAALSALGRAAELEPARAELHGLRGTALLRLQRWQEAVSACRRAIELKPDEASFHEALSHALFELGQYEDTVAAAHRCIELNPDLASPQLRLGAALTKLGRDAEAVAALQRAVEIDPTLADAHEMLAHALARLGERARAIEAFQALIRVDPAAKARVAVPLAELGFVDERDIAELRQSLHTDPDNRDHLLRLATLLLVQRNWDETIDIAQRVLGLQPDCRAAQRLIGEALFAQQRYEPAVEYFRKAVHDFSEYNFIRDDHELTLVRTSLQRLAPALLKLGREDEALAVLGQRLNVTFDPAACLEIGHEFQQRGKDDLATRSFVRAIVMDPRHLDAYKQLGDHLEKTGRQAEAKVVYDEVIAMGLGDEELRRRQAQQTSGPV